MAITQVDQFEQMPISQGGSKLASLTALSLSPNLNNELFTRCFSAVRWSLSPLLFFVPKIRGLFVS